MIGHNTTAIIEQGVAIPPYDGINNYLLRHLSTALFFRHKLHN